MHNLPLVTWHNCAKFGGDSRLWIVKRIFTYKIQKKRAVNFFFPFRNYDPVLEVLKGFKMETLPNFTGLPQAQYLITKCYPV